MACIDRTSAPPHASLRSGAAHKKVRVMPRIDRPALLLLLLFLLAPSAAAQTTTSTIEGTVTDASGAVLPGAEVKVSGTTLASERTATTGTNGFYRVTALPAGNYTLVISAQGFASRTAALELTLNRVVTFDVTLQVAGRRDGGRGELTRRWTRRPPRPARPSRLARSPSCPSTDETISTCCSSCPASPSTARSTRTVTAPTRCWANGAATTIS